LPLYPTQVTQEGTTSFRMKIDTTLLEWQHHCWSTKDKISRAVWLADSGWKKICEVSLFHSGKIDLNAQLNDRYHTSCLNHDCRKWKNIQLIII
jgi:hypothetical protein